MDKDLKLDCSQGKAKDSQGNGGEV